MKRHWSLRGTIYPWATPEYQTYALQTAKSLASFVNLARSDHFHVHLNVGGYEGQYSVPLATLE